VQFLTFVSGADQLEEQQGSFARFVLGDEPAADRTIQKPYGIASRDGVAYVCDTKGLSLVRLDFHAKSLSIIGAAGPGRLRKPLNIAIDSLGYKFVVDSERKQIVVFSPDDDYVTAFNVPGPCHPVDLALHENELFVLDNDESCQIVVMDRESGAVLRTIGGPGGGPGQFKLPNSIAVSPDGFLYVSDTHNWRIQKLTRDGTPVWTKGQPGYRLGQFGRPRGIRVGPDGIVYVVDGATEIVQMFDSEGRVLMRFGGPGNAPGALGLPSTLSIDKSSIPYFQRHVHEDFNVEYLLFVCSQYGNHLVNVYAFGSFPEGYKLEQSRIRTLAAPDIAEGIGPAAEADVPANPQNP
jgi:sugar lactone lactonase YvrE